MFLAKIKYFFIIILIVFFLYFIYSFFLNKNSNEKLIRKISFENNTFGYKTICKIFTQYRLFLTDKKVLLEIKDLEDKFIFQKHTNVEFGLNVLDLKQVNIILFIFYY